MIKHMSANNYIQIDRRTYAVTMRNAEDGSLLVKIGKAKNIDDAIDIAQDYQQNNIVEYGIVFTKKPIKLSIKKTPNVK